MLAPRETGGGARSDAGSPLAPLLPFVTAPPVVFAEEASVCGSVIHLAGVSIEVGGETICGSAAELDAPPLERAWYELAERLSVLSAMRRVDERFVLRDEWDRPLGEILHDHLFPPAQNGGWRAARSNGVAVGATWSEAARRAHWELVERDRVLRSWYGEFVPRRVDSRDVGPLFPGGIRLAYDVEVHDFGADEGGAVVGVFAFPRGDGPIAYGFAARQSLAAALPAAAAECVQRLGFLWGEDLPSEAPAPSPSPSYHQEFYLLRAHHRILRDWLAGEHSAHHGCLDGGPADPRSRSASLQADLTPPALRGKLRVAKAIAPWRVPLVFGRGHPWVSDVPCDLAVHPLA